jgi:hypothetical protein
MVGIIFLAWFFILGGGLLWLTHQALVSENARYGVSPDPLLSERSPAIPREHRQAA